MCIPIYKNDGISIGKKESIYIGIKKIVPSKKKQIGFFEFSSFLILFNNQKKMFIHDLHKYDNNKTNHNR